jgi:hypothetical protein
MVQREKPGTRTRRSFLLDGALLLALLLVLIPIWLDRA